MFNMNTIHKKLNTSEIYDKLREGHSLLKDILFAENYKELSEQQRAKLDMLSDVMYITEIEFTNF